MRISFAMAFVLLVAVTPARTGELHALLVSDTNNIMEEANVGNISVGVRVNIARMKTMLERVRRIGQIEVNVVEVTDDNFSCAKINAAVAALPVGPDDAVLFYYAGHGHRLPTTPDKFPELLCDIAVLTTGRSDAQLSKIADAIARKGARLTIAVADTCNANDVLPPATRPQPAARPPKKRAIERLFMEHKGRVTLSGAVPGTHSWYRTEGQDIGGLFTKQFLQMLNGALATTAPLPTWEKVVTEATNTIVERHPDFPELAPTIQQPQGESTAVFVH